MSWLTHAVAIAFLCGLVAGAAVNFLAFAFAIGSALRVIERDEDRRECVRQIAAHRATVEAANAAGCRKTSGKI